MSAPSGVVTFLFTDIEGSTRRWEADADAMRGFLGAHDEVLRSAIASHGGWLFKHTGDGVIAAFASPKSAVDAAIAAQRQLELPVRMGIATGEATLQDGDYFGAVLNRAARVMAAGHGGQILVADSTASLLNDVGLIDLGPRRLRDLPNPVTIFQLHAPGLPSEFPPLRTLDASPGNLRPAATSLIGRDAEVDEIAAAARSRLLVTLTGVGGVGKTRLALEVAAQLVDEFPDGVWVFELAAVTDPAAVPDAVGAVLGIRQQPGKNVSESVATAMEGRVRLLVFDNCEHILDAAADLIEAILRQSSTARIIATSREGLGVGDEQLWPVRSLDSTTAVDLFVERARNLAPDFSIDDEESTVAEICRRLDGIPLAIELAASRTASMSVGEIRDRLDHRFQLLVGSRRGLERHQTLRQAVQWSYDLLSDAERALLNRCSVFTGGFDLQSACALAGSGDTDDYAILDLLDALVRKSLVIVERSPVHSRYSMLETIRQFAEEQLAVSGTAAGARTAHARHFAHREADIMAMWDSPRQRYAYAWFAAELSNLRSAFRWAADHNDLDVAAKIATYVSFLGYMVETYEPIAWAEELIEPASATDHPRLAALYVLASQCFMAGRPEAAVRYGDAGQAVVADPDNDVPFGIQGWLGGGYTFTGQPERAVEWCRSELARDRDTHTLTRASLVLALSTAGAFEAAIAAAKDLVDDAKSRDNPCVLSYALLAYGFALRDSDRDGALESHRRGLEIAQDSGNRWNETSLAGSLCRLEAEHGDPRTAIDYFPVAIRNYHDSGNTTAILVPLAVLAGFLCRLKIYEPAAVIVGHAFNPVIARWVPRINKAIARLREVLGDQNYESLAHKGTTMTTAEMVAYAYEQIDRARAALEELP